ncbi:hypothetical protein [Acetobacter persici]|uniref:hypothetical protein n=1 Tax=Acetobacter persici TaxID=1076596 RepID=UPI001F20556E|nr:hypothetical protein [Acetobacter persici]MCG0998196.1 hypothetical protein [Acetobacter persici]
MTTDVIATNSAAITSLVSAGEGLVTTITGTPLTDNATKITKGITSVLDGLLPAVAERASFDLEGVLVGATDALTGINKAVAAAKSPAPSALPPATTETETTQAGV